MRAALVLGFTLAWFQTGSAAELIPAHGYVLSPRENGHVILRVDRVTGMLDGGVYAVRLSAAGGKLPSPGTEVVHCSRGGELH